MESFDNQMTSIDGAVQPLRPENPFFNTDEYRSAVKYFMDTGVDITNYWLHRQTLQKVTNDMGELMTQHVAALY
jgi:hypothetical protein